MRHNSRTPAPAVRLVASVLLANVLIGCSQQEPPPAAFEPNLVHALKHEIKEGYSTAQASKDATWIVSNMFGSPDDPTLPSAITADEDLATVVSVDKLHLASGPDVQGRGLYRKHCANCHGVTGNGRGETAAIINPYPRDYRMGVFKFKSTTRNAKPTHDDLVNLIANGIAGTPMKKIPELSEDDVSAITDYVIYLSMRGELERALIDDAVLELDLEGGDRVIDTQLGDWLRAESHKRNPNGHNPENYSDPSYKADQLVVKGEEIDEDLLDLFREFKEQSTLQRSDETLASELLDLEHFVSVYQELDKPLEGDDAEEPEQPSFSEQAELFFEDYDYYQGSWEIAEDFAAEIAESWLEAEDEVIEVPEPPADLPVAESYEQFVKLSESDQAESLAASVKRGQKLFVGKIASCSKCHGEKGLGNGQTNDYDDWTKDWTSRIGLKPEEREKLIPLMARGALPPINALPRNFEEGIFRGGGSSKDLYRRVLVGIAGTPMPASTFVEGQFEQQDIWHLINFIRSLQKPTDEPVPTT